MSAPNRGLHAAVLYLWIYIRKGGQVCWIVINPMARPWEKNKLLWFLFIENRNQVTEKTKCAAWNLSSIKHAMWICFRTTDCKFARTCVKHDVKCPFNISFPANVQIAISRSFSVKVSAWAKSSIWILFKINFGEYLITKTIVFSYNLINDDDNIITWLLDSLILHDGFCSRALFFWLDAKIRL